VKLSVFEVRLRMFLAEVLPLKSYKFWRRPFPVALSLWKPVYVVLQLCPCKTFEPAWTAENMIAAALDTALPPTHQAAPVRNLPRLSSAKQNLPNPSVKAHRRISTISFYANLL
jgi:hypothetical protein